MPLVRTIAALLAAVAVTGCGGGPGPAVEASDERVELALDDFFISPQDVRAEAGRLTFAVANRGRLGHNLRVRGETGEPVAVPTLLPGEQGSDTATLAPGSYRMLCTVANHEELGMTGTLVVR